MQVNSIARMRGCSRAVFQSARGIFSTVQSGSFLRGRCCALLLVSSTILAGVAGCHRPPSADVVATVNGKDIMRADLDRLYQARVADNPQKPSTEEADMVRLQLLHGMIADEIVQQRAATLNLSASDEDVNAKLTEMKAPYTEDDFQKKLKASNMTIDDLKRDIRRQLTREKLINKEIESKINITDAEISDYYTAHKADFNHVEPEYRIAQIAVTNRPAPQANNLQNNKATSDADAKRKIELLHNRLESGDDFSTVAMNFSEDPNTASNGGDMGSIPESGLKTEPQVYEAISKLKAGQFTDVIPVYDQGHNVAGYAIYKLIAREPAGQRELNDPSVHQFIHTTLHNNRAQLLENAYFEKLQNDAKVHNYLAEQVLNQGAH